MNPLQVMNFLNEVSESFPNAISFASGRPNSRFFETKKWPLYQDIFAKHHSGGKESEENTNDNLIYQYGPSAGIINDILSQHLQTDYSINTAENRIIVTNGCQEALTLICLKELIEPNDCMLTLDPSYIGLSGLVFSLNKRVEPISVDAISSIESGTFSFNWLQFKKCVLDIKAQGLNPKAIYMNPGFNNPLAYRIPADSRQIFLDICHELGLKIIEDDPYSRFNFTDLNVPSFKSLDTYDIVYFIGSFSKIFCPGLRVGFIAFPNLDDTGFKETVSLKSFLSLNTSPIPQSIVGGYLLANNFSLNNRVDFLAQQYKKQCESLLTALEDNFNQTSNLTWSAPEGGFFCMLNLPFEFSTDDVFECAKRYGVIAMPVSFFSSNPEKWNQQIRLAYSNYEREIIVEGVSRLSQYIHDRLGQQPQ